MRVWMSGGEVPKHRELFGPLGVEKIAVNLSSIIKERSGNLGDPDTLLPFPKLFYTSTSDADPADYESVIERYLDEESLVLGIESPLAKRSGRYIPEWHGGDVEELFDLAVEYGKVAVSEGVLATDSLLVPIRQFRSRNPSVALFVNSSKSKVINCGAVTDIVVSGWLAAQRHRELQVWDGTKVARSPRAQRNAQIEIMRSQIVALGADPVLVEEGDIGESSRLAVRSWLQYENVVATPGGGALDPTAPSFPNPVAMEARVMRTREALVALPVLSVRETPDAPMRPSETTLRQCDICSLNNVCPKYEQGSTCGFSIPVQLRTKTELTSVVNTMLEIQAQRVLMERFDEELQSQGVKQEVSAELERFFRMTESAKRISEERQTLTVTATASNSAGPLSELFGTRVGELSQGLRRPIDSDEIIDAAEILDDLD